ncbi:MAG: hypothetical protein K2H64_02255 [Desulfovibrio sp.]|nr:hypothetical protein [Desulfovibrio sp.]
MSYQLTEILNRCDKADADFLVSTIDSWMNFTDDKGLKTELARWNGDGRIPEELNRKIEREIRYLGSNDLAYMLRKTRGYDPAGVGVDEIIDDLCKLLKIDISMAGTLEARLEIFAGKVVDQQFARLPKERQIEILNSMKFDEHHRKEIFDKVIQNKELLLPVILPLLGRTVGPEVLQAFIAAILSAFVGKAAAQALVTQVLARLPIAGPWLGPLMIGATTIWSLYDLTGPASRKTIPLILYLGILCLKDGRTKDFIEEFETKSLPE